jgi:hypothetical protein
MWGGYYGGWDGVARGRWAELWREMTWPSGGGGNDAGRSLKKARWESRTIVFIDESRLSQRPHRCRTWSVRGQTPVLQYHLNWKTLSAIAKVSGWNFYFRFYPGPIRSAQVVHFLSHLMRQVSWNAADYLRWVEEPPKREGADFVREHNARLWWRFYPPTLRSSILKTTARATPDKLSLARGPDLS